ncbi:MAG TPA: flagellar biosynthetic protein FliO [Azospira sp.]|nr:flagellar biosynthetic protein FliO [Azospira sp.]
MPQDPYLPALLARLPAAGSLALLPTMGWAQAAPASPGLSGGSIVQAFVGLLIIIGLLLLATYFMRRLYGGRAFGQGPLKLLGGIAVGNRERILLVEVQDTWLVVGLAPGQIRTLHTLPKGELPQGMAGVPGTAPFAQWLNQVIARKSDLK